jgi:uncharacterized protein YecE (DUF72 family)
VNSTFYGQPRPEVTRAWVDRTPADFEFSVKLFQKFTHPRLFKERLAGGLPAEAQRDAALVDALARPNDADLDEFRRGIDPLASSGRLGALLAQFPASFKDETASRDYLAALLRAFAGYPTAVELRHRSWSDHIGETLSLLNTFGAAWVQIDEPKFRFSIRQNHLPNVQGFYYMRLHGRNAEKWWRHEKSEDRYDYLYSADELKEFSETAGAAKRLVKKLYLYTNNHFSAKSVANAVMIKQQLGEPIEGRYPPEFVDRFPDLAPIIPSRTPAESDLLARAEAAPPRRR